MEIIEKYFEKTFKLTLSSLPDFRIESNQTSKMMEIIPFHQAYLKNLKITSFDKNPIKHAFYYLLFAFLFISKFYDLKHREFRFFLEYIHENDHEFKKYLTLLTNEYGIDYICGFFPLIFDKMVFDIFLPTNISSIKYDIIKEMELRSSLSKYLFEKYIKKYDIDSIFADIFNL